MPAPAFRRSLSLGAPHRDKPEQTANHSSPNKNIDSSRSSSPCPPASNPESEENAYWADGLDGEENVSRACLSSFTALDERGSGKVSSTRLIEELANNGILLEDPRLAEMSAALSKMDAVHVDREMDLETFDEVTHANIALIHKALAGQLQVPDFIGFQNELRSFFEIVAENRSGKIADYIPELSLVDEDLFAISVCTVDGQQWSFGDVDARFCVQSCSKPISYMAAVEEVGLDIVHQHVGREPSGLPFNSMALKEVDSETHPTGARAIPHNVMVNAGAIMVSALLMEKEPSLATRYKSLLSLYQRLFGGKAPNFSNATFLSEKEKCDRNWCLAYMMKEAGAFPVAIAGDMKKILDFYFQACSIDATVDNMAMLAATLANGGVCPITSDRIFHSKTVRHCLSLLLSCGMYDFSGEWQFSVGLPAKSGVGGCVFITVPGVMGMAIYSPRLDANGNSVRAVQFAHMLGQRFRIHMFANLPCHDEVSLPRPAGSPERQGGPSDEDSEALPQQPDLLERRHQTSRHVDIVALLFAAASGDLKEIQRLVGKGTSVRTADYDLRTVLHVAASEGELEVLKYVVNVGKLDTPWVLSPLDRWGRTPLDDAELASHPQAADFLRHLGALTGDELREEILLSTNLNTSLAAVPEVPSTPHSTPSQAAPTLSNLDPTLLSNSLSAVTSVASVASVASVDQSTEEPKPSCRNNSF